VRDLGVGAQGEDVTELQNRLIEAGVYSGPVTGYFGPLTQGAVAAYQRKMGIVDTGFFGPLTRAEINKGLEMAESKVTNPQALAQIQSLQAKLAELMAQLVAKLKEQAGQ
jgi:peptidoglycan hydrolase-like protein with peptidoglycan-binding domain